MVIFNPRRHVMVGNGSKDIEVFALFSFNHRLQMFRDLNNSSVWESRGDAILKTIAEVENVTKVRKKRTEYQIRNLMETLKLQLF